MMAAASAAQGEAARKDAKDARRRRDLLDEREYQLNEEERRRQQELYGPIEALLAKDMASTGPSNWGLEAGDIERNYADLGRKVNENIVNSGLDNASGIQIAANAGLGLNKARDRSRAYMEALRRKRGEQFSFLQRYNPAGLTQMVAGSTARMANRQEGDAGMYDNESNQAWQAAGNVLMNGLMMEAMNNKGGEGGDDKGGGLGEGSPSAGGDNAMPMGGRAGGATYDPGYQPTRPRRGKRTFSNFMFGWGGR